MSQRTLLCASVLLGWASLASAQAEKETPVEKIRKVLDQKITLNYSGQDLQDICNHLKDKTGVSFVVDENQQAFPLKALGVFPGAQPAAGFELKADNAKLSRVLQRMLSTSGMTYVIADNSVVFVNEDQAAARVFGQRIHVKVEEVPLQKALKDIVRNAHFNLVIDPRVSKEADNKVTLTLDNTTLEASVKLLAELAGLKAVRLDNVLFITSEARADKMRLENPPAPANPNNRFPGFGMGGLGGAGFGGAGFAPVRIAPIVPAEAIPAPQKVPVIPNPNN